MIFVLPIDYIDALTKKFYGIRNHSTFIALARE
jgi:hypothetical protein